MTTYRIRITGDRFPTEYTVVGGSWQGAISRAIREWKRRFKGSRTKELTIKAFKQGVLLHEDNHE